MPTHPVTRYGLLGGLLLAAVFFAPLLVVEPSADWFRTGEVIGYTTMLLAMSATIFAIRAERRRLGGHIGFGRALGVGTGVSAIAAAIFAVATFAFYSAYGDTLVPMMMDYYAQQARAAGDPAQVAAKLAELERMRPLMDNHFFQAALMFATVFVIGVLESLLGAALLRRSPAVAVATA